MAIEVRPEADADVERAIALAVAQALRPPGRTTSAWLCAAREEAVSREPGGEPQARSPRSTRGATRA